MADWRPPIDEPSFLKDIPDAVTSELPQGSEQAEVAPRWQLKVVLAVLAISVLYCGLGLLVTQYTRVIVYPLWLGWWKLFSVGSFVIGLIFLGLLIGTISTIAGWVYGIDPVLGLSRLLELLWEALCETSWVPEWLRGYKIAPLRPTENTAVLLLVMLTFVTLLVGCSVNKWEPADSKVFDESVYILVHSREPFVLEPRGNYLLYKCDGLGLVCSLVHRTAETYSAEPSLVVRAAESTISIRSWRETVYTYSP